MNWFAKVIFDGRGRSKKHSESKSYLFEFLNYVKLLKTCKILKKSSSGSILIEFAVCMPVLIILLYYINDLSKLKRYYDQTEFVAQQMVNILQNITKTRKITRNDIRYAASLAYLTVYPGTTMFTVKSGSQWHTFNHQPRVFIDYVKGGADGKASTKWKYWIRTKTNTNNWAGDFLSVTDSSTVNFATDVTPSSIYPTLKVEEGKSKVLIDVQIRWNPLDQRDVNGKTAGSAREVFGLRLVNPKEYSLGTYFPSVVIFTPNGGFSEKRPS